MMSRVSTKLAKTSNAHKSLPVQGVSRLPDFLGISVIIIFDGVENSVFYSQVWVPLVEKNAQAGKPVVLISFESQPAHAAKKMERLLAAYPLISFHAVWRPPFMGEMSCTYCAQSLRSILSQLKRSYTLTARGALAGLVALKAHDVRHCIRITIQARGLAAAEYRYVHGEKSLWHRWRARSLESIERQVYTSSARYEPVPVVIESVSEALREYIIEMWQASPQAMSIAEHDIPRMIGTKTRLSWREKKRYELSIDPLATVYCYSGSAKAWQCPQAVIAFFVAEYERYQEELLNNSTALAPFLLILTQETACFNTLLAATTVPATCFYVSEVPESQLYRWLSVGDYGLLFREPHIMNWVSRPTKALEYMSAGLNIIHNDTIAWLMRDC